MFRNLFCFLCSRELFWRVSDSSLHHTTTTVDSDHTATVTTLVIQ